MKDDQWGPLGPIKQSPDDLMEISAVQLATKLVWRLERLSEFEKLAPLFDTPLVRGSLNRERELVRVAETAARARVRELAALVVLLGTQDLRRIPD
jgi:hypothetical protein